MGEQAVNSISAIAGSAITKNRFCKIASDGKWDHVGVAQANADGVSLMAAAGDLSVCSFAKPDGGLVWVEAAAAITVGGLVASDNAGKATPFLSGTVNRRCLGVAMSTVANAGELVLVQFSHYETDGGT